MFAEWVLAAAVLSQVEANRCAGEIVSSWMQAIVRVESSNDPLALHVNGGYRLRRQPASLIEALSTARWLAANGYNFDAGLAQVNSRNFAHLGLSPDNVFDPCANLHAASALLSENFGYARSEGGIQSPILGAISRYNTGNSTAGFRNGYVRKVVLAEQRDPPNAALITPDADRVDPIPLVRQHTPRSPAFSMADKPAIPPTDVFAKSNATDVFRGPTSHDAKDGVP